MKPETTVGQAEGRPRIIPIPGTLWHKCEQCGAMHGDFAAPPEFCDCDNPPPMTDLQKLNEFKWRFLQFWSNSRMGGKPLSVEANPPDSEKSKLIDYANSSPIAPPTNPPKG